MESGPEKIKSLEQKLREAMIKLGVNIKQIEQDGVYSTLLCLRSDIFEQLMKQGNYFNNKEILTIRRNASRP